MKRLLPIVAVPFLLGFCSQNATSQLNHEPMPNFGISLALGIPQNEFRQATDANGGGINLSLNIPVAKGIPIYAGADYTYMLYGMNRKRYDLLTNITVDDVVIDQILIPLEVKTSNNIHQFFLTTRAEAPINFIRPYIQGMAGFRYMSTRTTISDRSPDRLYSGTEDGVIGKERQLGSLSWSYGFAGGVKVRITEEIAIDLRCDYLYGGRAQFFDGNDTEKWQLEFIGTGQWNPEEIKPETINLVATPRESTTDMLMFHLGVSFVLH